MKTLNKRMRDAFMARYPTLLKEMTNAQGQVCRFYEHPLHGDDAPVYVEIDGVLADTGFADLGDFYEGSEYMPELFGCVIDCQFEIDKFREEVKANPRTFDISLSIPVLATLADGTELVSYAEVERQLNEQLDSLFARLKGVKSDD
jgi:hypothetical protein